MRSSKPFSIMRNEMLRDPEIAAAYLNEFQEDCKAFLVALKASCRCEWMNEASG